MLGINQTVLNYQIVESIGFYYGTTKGKWTPTEATPLVKDGGLEPPNGDFVYISVVWMILYLDEMSPWHLICN